MKTYTRNRLLQSGVTLVELMVGMAIGVLLLFGVGLLFSQNKQSFRQNEELARLQEEARFAIDELSRDLSMAGFVAEMVDLADVGLQNAAFEAATGATVSCGLTAGLNWYYDFEAPGGNLLESLVRIGDNSTGGQASALFPCINAANFQPDSDLIGLKRTSGAPSGRFGHPVLPNFNAPAGRVYIRENGSRAMLWQGTPPPDDDTGVAPPFHDWEYNPQIYYIRNFAVTAGDGVPTLCRIRLRNDGAGGTPPPHVEECIAQGVEDMQFEFGLDTNDDGAANVYVADPVPIDLTRLVSIRIYLLMRTINFDVGYTDDRTYSLSNKAPYTPGDRFHRRIYTSTVVVRNVNNLRQLGF